LLSIARGIENSGDGDGLYSAKAPAGKKKPIMKMGFLYAPD